MAPGSLPDHYATLEVERCADEAAIKRAYRKLVLKWHPDKNPANAEDAEKRIRAINAAYETMSNPFKRGQYDEQLQALERKAKGILLTASGFNPRMSIPREFMLSPMGYPDKFVRAVGRSAFVQSRGDVKVGFKEFFDDTKFTVWWITSRNNMCRVRLAGTTRPGEDMPEVGLNLAFNFEGNANISEVGISPWPQPECTSLVVVASPVSKGAYRFEAERFPGRYLAYRPPAHLRMVGGVVDETTSLDFVLVDYAQMLKFVTAEDVIVPAVTSLGGMLDYVSLDTLRAEANVVVYFKNVLGRAWGDDDFETFFDSRSSEWDYDARCRRVRLRSKIEQLSYMLRRSQGIAEVAATISGADEADVCALPLDTLEAMLNALRPRGPMLDVSLAVNSLDAQKKVLTALQRLCGEGTPLRQLAAVSKTVAGFVGEHLDGRVTKLRGETEEKLVAIVAAKLRRDGTDEDIALPVFTAICQVPSAWGACGERLLKLAGSLAEEAPLEELLPFLRSMLTARCEAEDPSLTERLCGRAQKLLRRAEPQAAVAAGAVEVLELLAAAGRSQDARAIAESLERLLPVASLAEVAATVAALGERGVEGSAMKKCAAFVGGASARCLAALPPATLLRLAAAAAKSNVLVDEALDTIADAAASVLANWTMDDAAKLLLAIAKVKGLRSDGDGIRGLYHSAAELMPTRLRASSGAQLIKLALAVGHVPACRALLEAAAWEAAGRLGDLPAAQLPLLTQSLLPLGGDHPALVKVLDFYASQLEDWDTVQNGADQLAKLAQALAPKAPSHDRFWRALAGRFVGKDTGRGLAQALTAAGKESLAAAFPKGGGPEFAGKRELLRLVRPSSRSRGRSRKRSRKRSSSRKRSRSRSRKRPR
mmetsp:Transcript_11655/g.31286  ORF Transcript_11655/g.31286 Transcript_11655/m.31286 type:complete len:878 (+) Transcript_11655:140-2773(+)